MLAPIDAALAVHRPGDHAPAAEYEFIIQALEALDRQRSWRDEDFPRRLIPRARATILERLQGGVMRCGGGLPAVLIVAAVTGACGWADGRSHQGRPDAAAADAAVGDGAPEETRPDAAVAVCDVPAPCDEMVAVSETGGAFSARLVGGDRTICLADGVVVSGPVAFAADGVTVFAPPGSSARFENSAGDAIDTGGHSDIALIGVTVVASGGSLPSALNAEYSAGVSVRCATLQCEEDNCYVVRAIAGSMEIESSTLLGGVDTSSYSYGLYGYSGSQMQVTDSTIRSWGNALNVTVGSQFSVTGGEITGLYPSAANEGTISVFNTGAALALTSVRVRTAGFAALNAGGAASGVSVSLDGVTFRKMAGTPAGQTSPMLSERADNVFDAGAPSTFCNEGSAADDGEFSPTLIAGAYDAAASSFDEVDHLGPDDCSAFE